MAFLSDSDNSVKVHVETVADGTGIKDTKDGISSIADTAKDSDGKMSSFTDNFSSGMNKVALATGVAGAGLTLYAKSGVDKLADLVKSSKDLSRQTGMTVEDSSKLTAAMGRMGVSSDQASIAFRTFSKVINDSRSNSADYALKQEDMKNKIEATKLQIQQLNTEITTHGDKTGALTNKVQSLNIQLKTYENNLGDSKNALDSLGVATQDANGKNRDFEAILFDVADKFKSMPDGAEKTADAIKLFGRSGTDMIKVLNGGSDAIKALEDQAQKLGLTLTAQNIGTINDYIKSQKDLAQSTGALQMQVGALTAPILTTFNSTLNSALTTLIGTPGPVRDVTAGFLAFSGPVLDSISAVAGFAGNIGSAIPLVKSLHAAISMPMVMGAIGVAGALADIALVIKAVMAAHDAIQAMNDAAAAQKALESTNASLRTAAAKAASTGNYAKADKLNKIANTNNPAAPTTGDYLGAAVGAIFNPSSWGQAFGFATGGFTGPGGVDEVAGIVHRGEYVLRQDQVDQRTGQPKMAGGNGDGGQVHYHSYDIGQVVLASSDAVHAFFKVNDRDAQVTSMGLSPNRGVA